MIGTIASAPPLDRRVIVDPGLLRCRDRACLRILYRCDVATTAQFTTLVYRRRQTAQERLSALHELGCLGRAAKGRRRLAYESLIRFRAGTQLQARST